MFARKYFGSVLWFFGMTVIALVVLSVGTIVASSILGEPAPYYFGVQYGQAIVAAIAVASIIGSTMGVLPFTKHDEA